MRARGIAVRPGFGAEAASPLLARIAAVPWGTLQHAYGRATDVPGQLNALVIGDDAARDEAWWNLWGNIHHQGTVYEATLPATPVLLGIAGWREHPDRVQALSMLRELAAGEGGDPQLRPTLVAGAEPLLDAWRDEPEAVRRALLWLLSVLPQLHERHAALIAETLPERHRRAWELEVAGAVDSQEDADAVYALEGWANGEAGH